ncbi:SGNH/GDSL hydrolase family protein [Peribacillus loiseleuriae]|uniref:SGNH/GDSL hydrolase family protein n=1 Tax=Peribacillus loiseleuriae TaxID=1679170 RepID=UPI00380C4163
MKKKIICLLIGLFLLTSCSNLQIVSNYTLQQENELGLKRKVAIPATFFPDPIEIVSLGDSLTQGVGDTTDKGGYLPYLRHLLEKEPTITSVNFVNHGVKGNRTDQLLKRMKEENMVADIKKADAVVITIGGNDIMRVFHQNIIDLKMEQFEKARIGYEKRLKQILNKVRLNNDHAQIYLVGVYNPFSKVLSAFQELDIIMDQWNRSGRTIVEGYDNAYFIEIGDLFENTAENLLFTEDHFHPNNRGYELIANRIYQEMHIETLGRVSTEASAKGDEE